MEAPEEKNRIEELKKSLYSRTAPDVRSRRKMRFSETESHLPTEWEHPPETPIQPVLNEKYDDHSMSFLTKLLIGSALFCVVAVGAGVYLFYNGANLISANNIDITISGPVSIPGGTPVSFDVNITNKNNVDLRIVDMAVDFPAGTTDPTDPAKELRSYRELIGDMRAGASAHKTIQAIIFGQENLQKTISVSLTYSIKGSSAVFTKTKTYDVLINSAPIVLSVSSFKEITSGEPFDIKISLKSNSGTTLKNILLKGSYPFGFTFISSDLKPLSDNATWRIGDIPPGGARVVTVHGTLQGENSDARVFRFAAGAQDSKNTNTIGTEYMSAEHDMTIEKPFISLGIAVNGDQSTTDYVGEFDRSERVEISWFNNLPSTVSNLTITAHLAGSVYDKTAVRPDAGYFRSATDDIIWSQQTNPDLASAAAGDSGKVSFAVIPRDLSSAANPIINPSITVSAGIAADRTQESNVPGTLSTTASRTIRVSSNVALSGRVVRSSGPFTNTGPIPPKVEQTTTYTVIWTVDNTSSTVGNAVVTATLPPHVKWLKNISPANEDVTYDGNSGTVTWNIGNVGTYTTSASRRREVDFQIALQPGINQADQAPTLVNQATLSALDTFTGAKLQSLQDYLTTRFSTDPAYKGGDETVVK